MGEKIKISKSEILQMIKEEYAKKKTEVNLKKRLDEVNKKIKNILSECGIKQEETLEEVEAGGEKKVASTAWTGEKNGDVKFDEKFQKKGTHKLEEDEELEIDMDEFQGGDDNGDEGSEEITADVTSDIPEEESSEDEIAEILKKLADAIEEKGIDAVETALETSEEGAVEELPTDGEEIKVSDEETPNGDEIEASEETIEENAEEPQDGHSPATEKCSAGPKPKTPYTEPQNVIKESKEKKKVVLNEEIKRMQILSGIRKPDEV